MKVKAEIPVFLLVTDCADQEPSTLPHGGNSALLAGRQPGLLAGAEQQRDHEGGRDELHAHGAGFPHRGDHRRGRQHPEAACGHMLL